MKWIFMYLEEPHPQVAVIMLWRRQLLTIKQITIQMLCWHSILPCSIEVAAIWKPGFKEWSIFLSRLGVYKVCCGTSNFTVCNTWEGVRICSEKGLCKLAQAPNLFKVLVMPIQVEKPENLCRNYCILKAEQLRISIHRAHSYS